MGSGPPDPVQAELRAAVSLAAVLLAVAVAALLAAEADQAPEGLSTRAAAAAAAVAGSSNPS